MLRGLTPSQLKELEVFDELYPGGEERMDRRFAYLAELLATGMNINGMDGQSFSTTHYLAALNGTPILRPPQDPKQAERFLDAWISGSNARFKEKKGKRLRKES